MQYSVIVVAAGNSTRFMAEENKLLVKPASLSDTVLSSSLSVFRDDEDCKQIIVSTNDATIYEAAKHPNSREVYCKGGASRSESVYNGLLAVTQDIVLVHDGARCYLLKEDLEALKKALESDEAAILTRCETDTIKQVENGYIVKSIDRSTLNRAQTPQGFRTDDLIKAYNKAFKDKFTATDDASIMEQYSDVKIKCVIANGTNEKVTFVSDVK